MSLKNIFFTLRSINLSVVAALMLAFTFTSCEYGNDWSPYKSNAEINATLVSAQGGTISGVTVGDPMLTWNLVVNEGGSYCSVVNKVGFVGNQFSVKFTENTTENIRTAKVTITFSDGFSKSFSLRQLVPTDNTEYDRAWAEQPAYKDGISLIHKTYYTTLSDGRRVRNFSQ